jgi:hypothetical protein
MHVGEDTESGVTGTRYGHVMMRDSGAQQLSSKRSNNKDNQEGAPIEIRQWRQISTRSLHHQPYDTYPTVQWQPTRTIRHRTRRRCRRSKQLQPSMPACAAPILHARAPHNADAPVY